MASFLSDGCDRAFPRRETAGSMGRETAQGIASIGFFIDALPCAAGV
jgi:hypothetical protein